jgi:hypothetical protein
MDSEFLTGVTTASITLCIFKVIGWLPIPWLWCLAPFWFSALLLGVWFFVSFIGYYIKETFWW